MQAQVAVINFRITKCTFNLRRFRKLVSKLGLGSRGTGMAAIAADVEFLIHHFAKII